VFKQIKGIVSAYGIQASSGEVVPISDKMRVYCQQKDYPIVELDEWEEEEEEDYSSSSSSIDEHNTADDKDSYSSKELSDDELTDGEDIIEDTDEE